MLDKIDQQIEEWVRSFVGDIDVSFEPPGTDTAGHRIGVYLFDIRRTEHRVGGNSHPPFRLELRYLITSWSQQPKEAHRALGQLLCRALESREFEVDSEPPAASFWNAFKCAPRPCFVLRVPVHHELTESDVPPVTVPPEVRSTTSTALWGTVYGPNRTPLSGATVELAGLAPATRTNRDGHFRFDFVPADPFPGEMVVAFKGRVFRHPLRQAAGEGQPLVIEIPLGELQPAS